MKPIRISAPDYRTTAWAGFAYFALYLAFSTLLFRERFMVDGAYMIFEMANTQTFPSAQNRYIIWLLNLLPVTAIRLELPLSVVMMSWLANYVLFYAAAFYFVLLVCRNLTCAWFLLFINSVLLGTQFFNIADEITPSAVTGIMVFAIWSRYRARPPIWAIALSVVLLYFTVFGHLLVSLGIIAAAVYLLLNRPSSRLAAARFALPAVLFGLFFALRYVSGLQDNYEAKHLAAGPAHFAGGLDGFNLSFLIDFLQFYIRNFSVLAVLIVALLIRLWWIGSRFQALFLILMCAIWLIPWYYTIQSRFGEVVLSTWFNVPVRWLYPVNFLLAFAVFESGRRLPGYWARFLAPGFLLVVLYQFSWLYSVSEYPANTLKQVDALAAQYPVEAGQKFYLADSLKCPYAKYHSVYTNTLVFTAMDGPDAVRQFVLARQDELDDLLDTPDDVLYLTGDLDWPMDEVNPVYFRVSPQPYKSINRDFSNCAFSKGL